VRCSVVPCGAVWCSVLIVASAEGGSCFYDSIDFSKFQSTGALQCVAMLCFALCCSVLQMLL